MAGSLDEVQSRRCAGGTLASLHRCACSDLGSRPALRYKQEGRFHDLTWQEYRHRADQAAAGLIGLGVRAGDRVAILSENRLEWLIADHAILSAGAVNVPLHAPLTPVQAAYQLGHSGSRGIFVSGQEQARKVRQIAAGLPDLEFLISFDPVQPVGSLRTLDWGQLQEMGRAGGTARVLEREAALSGADLATIIYTSGTTGDPKGVMLTHSNLLSNARATVELYPYGDDELLLSWLPYSHIYARTVDHYSTTLAGSIIALSPSMDEALGVDLALCRPTWVTAVPRFYEKLWGYVEHLAPEPRAAALRRALGGNIRRLSSGGAPLPRHVCEGFFAVGIPLLEGYGLTESSPVISFNHPGAYRIGSVGRALPGVEVKIADDGEILTRGPHVMKGYWKDPQATDQTLMEGWLHTGDVGRLDAEGFLYITDRKKDLLITSAGKNIAPTELERLLVSDPCIDQAVVYGDGRHFVSALVVPNFEALGREVPGPWAPTPDGFIRDPRVHAFLGRGIAILMEAVSNPERVKAFLVLAHPFTQEAQELTPSLKVRRRFIISKYETHLAALYQRETDHTACD